MGAAAAEAEAPSVHVKPGREISPNSLQAPDDPDATYRTKGQQGYTGYAVNVTDTCDPENPFQLIVKVQTAPNITEDTTFLLDALPNLQARTDLHTLYNDAAYCSPEVDQALHTAAVAQVPTALKGQAPSPNQLHLADYTFQFDAAGRLTHRICPHGEILEVEPGRKAGRYRVRRSDRLCAACTASLAQADPSTVPALRFSQADLARALRRQRCQAYRQEEGNLRAAIEAVMGAVKRPFKDDQLPVRGTFRMSMVMVGAAALVNIRRIQRYLVAKNKPEGAVPAESGEKQAGDSFGAAFWGHFRRRKWFFWHSKLTLVFGY